MGVGDVPFSIRLDGEEFGRPVIAGADKHEAVGEDRPRYDRPLVGVADAPQFPAAVRVVAADHVPGGTDHLPAAVGLDQEWRAKRPFRIGHLRAGRLPGKRSGAAVERGDERIGDAVAGECQQVADEDRRASRPMLRVVSE